MRLVQRRCGGQTHRQRNRRWGSSPGTRPTRCSWTRGGRRQSRRCKGSSSCRRHWGVSGACQPPSRAALTACQRSHRQLEGVWLALIRHMPPHSALLTRSEVVGLRGVGDTVVVGEEDTLGRELLEGGVGGGGREVGVLEPDGDEAVVGWRRQYTPDWTLLTLASDDLLDGQRAVRVASVRGALLERAGARSDELLDGDRTGEGGEEGEERSGVHCDDGVWVEQDEARQGEARCVVLSLKRFPLCRGQPQSIVRQISYPAWPGRLASLALSLARSFGCCSSVRVLRSPASSRVLV